MTSAIWPGSSRIRPEWLSTIRGLILTDEVLRLPETMAELDGRGVGSLTAEQFRVVNERLERLDLTDASDLKSDMAEVKDDVADG